MPKDIKKAVISTDLHQKIVEIVSRSISDVVEEVEEGLTHVINNEIEVTNQKLLTIDGKGNVTANDVDLSSENPVTVIKNLKQIIGKKQLKEIVERHL